MSTSRVLAFRGAVAVLLAAAAISLPSVVQAVGAGPAPRPSVTLTAAVGADTARNVDGQNAMDHDVQMAHMDHIAEANGLTPSNGGACGDWYQFRTATGVHCAKAPMLRNMFTAEQLAEPPVPAAEAAPSKVTCIGNGTDGKRMQLLYARRANKADTYTATAPQMQGWAATIEQTLVLSAKKTGGVRKMRWVTDSSCVPTVLHVTVPNDVTDFSALVSALQDEGYKGVDRKYLVAWDDGDSTAAFCGLGETMPYDTPGSTNPNETQPLGAMFAAIEPNCWRPSVAAHEVMHTLGAVQNSAPHSTKQGHCTDESDIMCYADHSGVVMTQTCPTSQESLYDCNDDDYFNTNPPAGNYLKTHWNPADSGWLDKTGSLGPPGEPQLVQVIPVPAGATVSWTAPAYDGGSAILAYVVTLQPGGRTVTVAAPATTVTIGGLADGTAVTATITAVNASGEGVGTSVGPVTPAPTVPLLTGAGTDLESITRAPGGALYGTTGDSIVKIAADGTRTTVVHGTPPTSGRIPENTLPLDTPVSAVSAAVAPNGDLYWFDAGTSTIRRLSAGRVNSVAGNGTFATSGDGGPATSASIRPHFLAINPVDSAVFFTDESRVVRRFTVGGTITTVAGIAGGGTASAGDGGPATSATFVNPNGLAIDGSGTVYVADRSAHRIRRFTVGGTIATAIGDGTTTYQGGSPVPATSGSPYPMYMDWSPEQGLVSDMFGMERRLVGANLVELAGIPSGGATSSSTLAPQFSFVALGSTAGVVWSGSSLYVLLDTGALYRAGPWSSAATATLPIAPPRAPIAASGVSSAKVSWVPAGNGGSPITAYKVTANPGGAVTTVAATALSTTISGLDPNTSYTFTVSGVNAKGTGPASALSNAISPTPPPKYLPFASWSALVTQQYVDLTTKAPSASALSSWVSQLTAGTKTKGDLDDALRKGTENLANVDPVVRVYRAFLGRAPDAGGLKFWIKRKRNVAPAKTYSVTQIATEFTSGSEFKTKYGSLTNRQFVTRIYTDVLGRKADTSGVDFWTRQLDTKKKTKAQVMVGFSESNEYKTKQAQNTDAAVAYAYLLNRAPTVAELADWVTREKAGTTDATLLTELLQGTAYAARFGG